MKPYQKLAEQFATEYATWDSFIAVQDAYEAGFLKAKELMLAMEDNKTRFWFEIPMRHLKQLGEVEVDDE